MGPLERLGGVSENVDPHLPRNKRLFPESRKGAPPPVPDPGVFHVHDPETGLPDPVGQVFFLASACENTVETADRSRTSRRTAMLQPAGR